MYKLVISDDEGKNTVVPLVRDEITIGRKEGNTIRLTERNVSRRHARLVKANGRFAVEDLRSYNGVRVNGQRIGAETTLDPGDQIQIGDYQLALQIDGADSATLPEQMSPMVADADTAMIASPGPPARLVMITPPAPGAEFALTSDRMRVGRAEDLEIWVNHRSISREHAEIQKEPDGGLRLIDLGSANGVRVNSQDVQNALLAPGDVVELGQVRFRFVGAGEHYAFDADRTVQMDAVTIERPSGSRVPMMAAIAIVLLAVVGAGVVAFWGGGGDADVPTAGGNDIVEPGPVEPAPPVLVRGYDAALAACRTAATQSQFASAVSHADVALAERPEDADATACRALGEQGQAFERGFAHFQAGNFERAYFEFENLPDTSPLRARPQVAQAVQGYANSQITACQRALATNAAEALSFAQFVQNMRGISADQRAAAVGCERAAQQRGATPPPVDPHQPAVAQIPRTPRNPPSSPRTPQTPRPVTPTQEATPPRPTTPVASGGGDENRDHEAAARECTMTGNNACVIRELEGRARTERALGMLIEAYRARGQTQNALRHMRTVVQRFPGTPSARQYQQILNQHGGN